MRSPVFLSIRIEANIFDPGFINDDFVVVVQKNIRIKTRSNLSDRN